jgi:hypothetical protein
MGFVGAISASLAVIILIAVSSLVAYVDAIAPRVGLSKISDLHYRYVMKNVFVRNDSMVELSLLISDIEEKEKISLQVVKPMCNYGFNMSQREIEEIVTYNYIKLNLWYKETVDVEKVDSFYLDNSINYCQMDFTFKKK